MTVVDIQISPATSAGAKPRAAGAYVEPSVAVRHARVQGVLELSARQRAPGRDTDQATLPLPTPPPTRIVGVNSERLCRGAGHSADGINLPWSHHDATHSLRPQANASAGFLRTAYTTYDGGLPDPTHPDRVPMTERWIDRLVLAVFGVLDDWL